VIGTCKACISKDEEILFLREQVKIFSSKLIAMADPMLEERQTRLKLALLQAQRVPLAPTGPKRAGIQELARRNPDVPSADDREQANNVIDMDRKRVEDSFRVPADKRQP
jgi:hypothetical protein